MTNTSKQKTAGLIITKELPTQTGPAQRAAQFVPTEPQPLVTFDGAEGRQFARRIWHSPQTRHGSSKPAPLRPARALCDDPRGRFLTAEARASHAPDSTDCPIAMMPANWRVDALPSPASLFAGRPVSTGGREAHGFAPPADIATVFQGLESSTMKVSPLAI